MSTQVPDPEAEKSTWTSRSGNLHIYFTLNDDTTWTGTPAEWQTELRSEAKSIRTMHHNVLAATRKLGDTSDLTFREMPYTLTADEFRIKLVKLERDLRSATSLFSADSAMELERVAFQDLSLNWQSDEHRRKLVWAYGDDSRFIEQLERSNDLVAKDPWHRTITAAPSPWLQWRATAKAGVDESPEQGEGVDAQDARDTRPISTVAQDDSQPQRWVDDETDVRDSKPILMEMQRMSIAQGLLDRAQLAQSDQPRFADDWRSPESLLEWINTVQLDPDIPRTMFERDFDLESSPERPRADLRPATTARPKMPSRRPQSGLSHVSNDGGSSSGGETVKPTLDGDGEAHSSEAQSNLSWTQRCQDWSERRAKLHDLKRERDGGEQAQETVHSPEEDGADEEGVKMGDDDNDDDSDSYYATSKFVRDALRMIVLEASPSPSPDPERLGRRPDAKQ